MKLFGYAGTMHTPSFTESIIRRLAEKCSEKGIITEQTIETSVTAPIELCTGCLGCYKNGICHNDKKDSMGYLRQQLLDADIIVIGSPVYIHDVSATAKNFIDRLATWMYIYNLRGKTVITVSSSTSNGNIFVDKYLGKIMKIMGGNVAYQLAVTSLDTNETLESKLNECCEKLSFALENGITEPDKLQETYFLNNRINFTDSGFQGFIKDIWNENGFFGYEEYSNLFNDVLKEKKVNIRGGQNE